MLMISPISNNQNNNIGFGHRLPRRVFYDIREIPSLKCACCGGDMFNKQEIKHYTNSFLAGSKRALENGVMAPYRGTPAFEFAQMLSEIEPKKTLGALMAMPENKFKIRTLDAQSQIDLNMMRVLSEGVSVKASRVMKKLERHREFFDAEDSAILELMDLYAQQYPKKTFVEIFNIPEIAAHHQEVYQLEKEREAAMRISVFKRLKEYGDTLNPQDAAALRKTNSKVLSIVNNDYYQAHIKEGLVREAYNEFCAGATGKVSKRKINNIIRELPCSGMTPDKFIVEALKNKSSDMEIVSYFVQRLQATREHFKAKSDFGADKQKNIIVLCQKCNRERSNLPYPFFLRFHPEMIKNLQSQVTRVITYITHGKLIGYDEYPVASKKIILENSNNILRPKIGEFLKFRKQKAQQKLEQATAVLNSDNATFEVASRNLEEVDGRIKELEAQMRKLKKERQGIAEEYKKAETVRNNSQEQVDKRQRFVDEVQEVIDNDKAVNQSLKYKRRNLKKLK